MGIHISENMQVQWQYIKYCSKGNYYFDFLVYISDIFILHNSLFNVQSHNVQTKLYILSVTEMKVRPCVQKNGACGLGDAWLPKDFHFYNKKVCTAQPGRQQ